MGVSSWGQQHGIAPELVRNAHSWPSPRGAGSAIWGWACFTNCPGYSDGWLYVAIAPAKASDKNRQGGWWWHHGEGLQSYPVTGECHLFIFCV